MGNQTRPHVLLVDDHPEIANTIAHVIERAGFPTSCAADEKASLAEQLVRESEGGFRVLANSAPVVACELRYGAAKRRSKRLTRQVEAVLGAIAVLPLEPGMDRHYAEIRAALEKRQTPIGANDLLIAAHALTLRAVCVTANVAGSAEWQA